MFCLCIFRCLFSIVTGFLNHFKFVNTLHKVPDTVINSSSNVLTFTKTSIEVGITLQLQIVYSCVFFFFQNIESNVLGKILKLGMLETFF